MIQVVLAYRCGGGLKRLRRRGRRVRVRQRPDGQSAVTANAHGPDRLSRLVLVQVFRQRRRRRRRRLRRWRQRERRVTSARRGGGRLRWLQLNREVVDDDGCVGCYFGRGAADTVAAVGTDVAEVATGGGEHVLYTAVAVADHQSPPGCGVSGRDAGEPFRRPFQRCYAVRG